MKKLSIFLYAFAVLFGVSEAFSASLFSENFENDLSAWRGKDGDVHHGVIVPDPLGSSDSVLTFTWPNAAGDIFTIASFSSFNGKYILSFDYLGIVTPKYLVDPNYDPTDLGGAIGHSYDFSGLPGTHTWLGATGIGGPDILPDTGNWEHVVIPFETSGSIHLMFEDFIGSYPLAGDVFFDNIELSEVPIPTTLLLLGSGLAALMGARRKRERKNSIVDLSE